MKAPSNLFRFSLSFAFLPLLFHGLACCGCGSERSAPDRYGGWTSLKGETTGFFHVEEVDGRHWMVTPDGNVFFSMGINHTDIDGYYEPDRDRHPYRENVLALYGSEEGWAEETAGRLTAWGLNTIGSWSSVELLRTRLPYTVMLDISGGDWLSGYIPDYFSEAYQEHAEEQALQRCGPRRGDPMLVGYFLDNELHWGPDWRSRRDLFYEFFALPAESAGKRALVNMLRERHGGDMASLNSAWEEELESFDELMSMDSIGNGATRGPTDRAEGDRSAFRAMAAERYFDVACEAVRRHDPDHMILGVRFVSHLMPAEVVRASASCLDVVSVNHYELDEDLRPVIEALGDFVSADGWLREFHELSGRPLLVSEFSFRAADSGLPNTRPPSPVIPVLESQGDRADGFEDYATRCQLAPYMVGYHWYAYMDEPATGRFDGENSNFGLVNERDEPYLPLVNRMTLVNPRIYGGLP